MHYSGSRTGTGTKVVLNVYDLGPQNEYLYPWGLGTYHSGVHVFGREHTFASGSGVFSHEPKEVPGEATFRESIDLGEYCGSRSDFDRIIDELKSEFGGGSYNLMTKNCNHFAEALATRLVNKPFPGYVNRMANLGGMVSCLIPPGMLGDAPVGGQQQSGAGETSMGGYQVIVPRNRQTNSTPSTASITAQTPQVTGGGGFIGKGMKLGGGIAEGSRGVTSTMTVDETERREKARAAALKRMAASSSP